MSERRIEYVPLADVVPAETNPKLHAEGDLLDSLAEHGYGEPVLLDERTGRLVAGHGRLEALLTLHAAGRPVPDGIAVDESGGWSVPVVRGWSSRDDAQAARYLIAANRLTEKGGWDSAALADMLADLERTDTLVGTGYGPDDLAELLAGLAPVVEPPAPLTDPDDVPAAPADPVTVRGDVWLLGPHRLMCGDCRDADDVGVLLGEDRVNVAFTSPPYAQKREYDPSSGFTPIPPDDYVDWFAPVAALVAEHLADDGSWLLNIRAGCDDGQRLLYVHDLVAAHARVWGWRFIDDFCWVDGYNGVPGRWPNRFKDAWEPVFHFALNPTIKMRHLANAVPTADAFDYAPGQVTGTGSGLLHHDERRDGWALPSNVLRLNSENKMGDHPAPFPVALPQWFIKAFSDEGDVVYDPFVGSGSTILAADQTGRAGRGMELSPAYCDVAARRYQRHTGIKPIRESTGEPVDFG